MDGWKFGQLERAVTLIAVAALGTAALLGLAAGIAIDHVLHRGR